MQEAFAGQHQESLHGLEHRDRARLWRQNFMEVTSHLNVPEAVKFLQHTCGCGVLEGICQERRRVQPPRFWSASERTLGRQGRQGRIQVHWSLVL